MIQFLIWFAGVVLCGFGIIIVLFGICMHRESLKEILVEVSWKWFFFFNFIALIVDFVGSAIFYGGYCLMELLK